MNEDWINMVIEDFKETVIFETEYEEGMRCHYQDAVNWLRKILERNQELLHQELQKALAIQAIQIREEEANEYNKIIEREIKKAQQTWLREEIVKLEGMKTHFVPADVKWFGKEDYSEGEYKLVPAKDPSEAMDCLTCGRFLPEEGCNCGTVDLQTIIDRYLSELDQPINSIFKK